MPISDVKVYKTKTDSNAIYYTFCINEDPFVLAKNIVKLSKCGILHVNFPLLEVIFYAFLQKEFSSHQIVNFFVQV